MSEPSKSGFTDALESLVRDRSLREEMGRRAQEYAIRELSMEQQILGFASALNYAANSHKDISKYL